MLVNCRGKLERQVDEVKGLIWKRLAATIVVAGGVMIFIAVAVVDSQDLATVDEVMKHVETVEQNHIHDMERLEDNLRKEIDKVYNAQMATNREIKKLTEILITHDKNGDQ